MTSSIKTEKDLPREISHYTTLEGLKGIVESRALWASNALFLNDSAELRHALDASEKVIRKFASQSALKNWSPIIKRVFKELNSGSAPDTYVTCFCEDDDALSQWRGYGGLEQGISITFDRRKLSNRLKDDEVKFMKVDYSLYSTANRVHKAISEHVREIAELDGLVGFSDEEKTDAMRLRVSSLLPRFKHIGFQDEHEWRFVVQSNIKKDNVNFRVSRNKIVPYILLGKNSERLPIESVRVGPGQDQILTTQSVEFFLRSYGYNVEVEKSEVPFRA